MTAYYNEIEPYAAQWLRNLIAAGHIAPGDVDERSIVDVKPDDLRGYAQCHFFAGIGGWSLAARLAGWPDDRPLWTGSEPCQPYSVAGKGLGEADPRFLRPFVHGLVAGCRPPVYMGEQVAAAAGKHWLDRVHTDMESIGYTCRSAVVPACAVDAPHRRDRLWFVADPNQPRSGEEWEQRGGQFGGSGSDPNARPSDVADSERVGREVALLDERSGGTSHSLGKAGELGVRRARYGAMADACGVGLQGLGAGDEAAGARGDGPWGPSAGAGYALGADGKARRVKSGLRLLAHGVPARVGKLRAYGNAIVPQVAAEVIRAYMETVDAT